MTKKLKHVIKAQDFDRKTIDAMFVIAQKMEKELQSWRENECVTRTQAQLLAGHIMASLFYEPSTRTRFSFESAMQRLGGIVIGLENANEFSSRAKGESLADTIRVVGGYCDVIVLRHDKAGGAEIAQKHATIPIINAGDGPGQHPTQALLDLYTIHKKFGEIKDLNIAMIGDLANGRTVRSLAYFLAKHYPKNRIHFVSPPQVRMHDDIKKYLDKYRVEWGESDHFRDIISIVDVFYQTRVQEERFEKKKKVYQEVVKASKELRITKKVTQCMKKDAIIMHPLPRKEEISIKVDADPRAAYFDQAENGLYVRMALLKMALIGY